jgi:hypothetical protein
MRIRLHPQRGDFRMFQGEKALVMFTFNHGTDDQPRPWAKVMLPGARFRCVLMSMLMPVEE